MTQTNSHKKAQSSQTFPISIRSLLCFSCAFSWPYHIKTRAVARTEFGGRFRFKSTHFCLSAPCFNLPKAVTTDRKSTRLNSSHGYISYAVFCLKKKKKIT